MTWTKVIDGPVLRDEPALLAAQGDWRDEDGLPLTGIFTRDDHGVENKVIFSNGHDRFGWKYPMLDLVFTSPLVNDLNLYCCRDGWTWEDDSGPMNSDLFSIARAAGGLKPGGVCLLPPGQPQGSVLDRFRAGINTYSLDGLWKSFPDRDQFELTLVRPEPVAELFDLERFDHDWRLLIEASPDPRGAEGQLAQALAELRRARVRDFLADPDFDLKNPLSLAHWIIVGLLLGYPVATTAAMALWPPKPPDVAG